VFLLQMLCLTLNQYYTVDLIIYGFIIIESISKLKNHAEYASILKPENCAESASISNPENSAELRK